METENITIRALCPDNEVKLKQLISLFHATYGDTFPIRGVYDLQFWKNQISGRFVSMAAEYEGEVIAHLAIYPDPECPGDVQLAFPVCHPRFLNCLPFFADKLKNLFKNLAIRQGWDTLYMFILNDEPTTMKFATDWLGFSVGCMLPAYLPASNLSVRCDRSSGQFSSENRTNVVVAFSDLTLKIKKKNKIFVPKKHIELCAILFSTLGLQRDYIGEPTDFISSTRVDRVADSCKRAFPNVATTNCFVSPSAAPNLDDMLLKIFEKEGENLFIFVDIEDPLAPALCERLESDYNFVFNGICPKLRNRDRVVYASTEATASLHRNSCNPAADRLAKYVLAERVREQDASSAQLHSFAAGVF